MTSANALIPIIYYIYTHPKINFFANTPFDVDNTSRIRNWFLLALLNNTFSGQSDRALTDTRKVLLDAESSPAFPADAINRELRRTNRKASFDEETVETILALTYSKPLTVLVLSLLLEDNHQGLLSFHQDHIFPQDHFKPQYMKNAGLSYDQQQQYKEMMNHLGNLQLLSSTENLEKSNQDFITWLATRDTNFRKKYLIPDDNSLLAFDRFPEIHVRS